MTLNDEQLIAIYAALTHSIHVCKIFESQSKNLRQASLTVLNSIEKEMENRNLLES